MNSFHKCFDMFIPNQVIICFRNPYLIFLTFLETIFFKSFLILFLNLFLNFSDFFGFTIFLYPNPILFEVDREFSVHLERFSHPLLKLEIFLLISSSLVLRLEFSNSNNLVLDFKS